MATEAGAVKLSNAKLFDSMQPPAELPLAGFSGGGIVIE